MNKPESEQAKNWAYYTPDDVVLWVRRMASEVTTSPSHIQHFDPACGDGRLIAGITGSAGWDINHSDTAKDTLDSFLVVDDSLDVEWPVCGCVVMNPPFGSRSNDLAGKFVRKALQHMKDGKCNAVVAVLRTSLLQTKSRLDIPMPSHRLDMSWRPRFVVGGEPLKGGYHQDFSVYRWLPTDLAGDGHNTTAVVRITKDGGTA